MLTKPDGWPQPRGGLLVLLVVLCILALAGCRVFELVASDDISTGSGEYLSVADDWEWNRSNDAILVQGDITNTSDRPLYWLDVGVRLETNGGRSVIEYGRIPAQVLKPGQTARFTVVIEQAPPPSEEIRVGLYKAYWSPVP